MLQLGLGGYSITSGRAWRWQIPAELQGLKSINYLEFLARIGGLILLLWEDNPAAGDCYLNLGDNTSSLGWLRNSNFADRSVSQISGLRESTKQSPTNAPGSTNC